MASRTTTVTVSTAGGKTLTVRASTNSTILELKVKMQAEHSGGAPAEQSFVLGGEILADDLSIEDAGLQEESVLMWIVKKAAAAAKTVKVASVVATLSTGAAAPGARAFPAHWGAPPKMCTKDLRPFPGGFVDASGRSSGSGTIAKWIQTHMDADAAAVTTSPTTTVAAGGGSSDFGVEGDLAPIIANTQTPLSLEELLGDLDMDGIGGTSIAETYDTAELDF